MALTNLNSLGSAIRAKVGETEKKSLPELTEIINGLVKPDDSQIVTKIVIQSAVMDLSIGEALIVADCKLKYKNSEVFFIPNGDNSPSSGSYTFCSVGFGHSGTQIVGKAYETYVSGRSKPRPVSVLMTGTSIQIDNTDIYINSDGYIFNENPTSTNIFVASGNSLRFFEIPITKEGTIDLTLWDED